jgi:HEPN domain-containing protein
MKIDMPKEWLKASKLDLENLKYIIEVEHLTSVVAFHSQQSIEKSFKAIIEYKKKKIPKQHDLLKLKKMVNDVLVVENDDILEMLNQLYIESRYPGDLGLLPYGQPTLADAKEFYELALSIFEEVCTLLDVER